MRNIGIATDEHCVMPFTQIVLADAVGLTPVHVNRSIKKLRLAGAMETTPGALVIASLPRLAEISGFDGNYLHRSVRPRQSALDKVRERQR